MQRFQPPHQDYVSIIGHALGFVSTINIGYTYDKLRLTISYMTNTIISGDM